MSEPSETNTERDIISCSVWHYSSEFKTLDPTTWFDAWMIDLQADSVLTTEVSNEIGCNQFHKNLSTTHKGRFRSK